MSQFVTVVKNMILIHMRRTNASKCVRVRALCENALCIFMLRRTKNHTFMFSCFILILNFSWSWLGINPQQIMNLISNACSHCSCNFARTILMHIAILLHSLAHNSILMLHFWAFCLFAIFVHEKRWTHTHSTPIDVVSSLLFFAFFCLVLWFLVV